MGKKSRISRNAIILAAGLGSRLRPLTNVTPKCLLPVNDKPIIENTIEMLLKNGITDITIVTGYLERKLGYLVYKYSPYVSLVHNDKYDTYNNIWTMSLVLDKLNNTYVVDGDLYITDDRPFRTPPTKRRSAYYVTQRFSDLVEWYPVTEGSKVTGISVDVAPNDYSMSGISYWSSMDCSIIKSEYPKYMTDDILEDSSRYWDDIPRELLSTLNVTSIRVKRNSVIEIDTVDEYTELCRGVR